MLKFKHKKIHFRQELTKPKVTDLKNHKKICHAELDSASVD